jgi:hypothetical protein
MKYALLIYPGRAVEEHERLPASPSGGSAACLALSSCSLRRARPLSGWRAGRR